MKKKPAGKIEIVIVTLWFGLLCIIVHYIVTSSIIRYESDRTDYLKIQDFHWYILLIQSFWSNEITSVYDPLSQLKAVGSHFGIAMNQTMPVGISPTALLILLPFSLVAKFSFPLANTLWVSASMTVFSVAVLKTYAHIVEYERNRVVIFIAVFSVFLFSFRTVSVIFLGQASLLASGLLLLLLLEMTLAKKEGRSLRRWLVHPILFILSMKLHYFALGIAILLLGGFLYETLASFAMLVLSVGILLAYAGPGLLTGFLEQLSVYSTNQLPAYYDMRYISHTYITFRNAFAPILGEAISLTISLIVLAIGCIALFWLSVSRCGESRKRSEPINLAMERQVVALFALLLLFMPYLGGYEDTLACIPFASVFLTPDPSQRKHGKLLLLIPLLFVFLNQSVMFPSEHLWIFWGLKASIFVFLLYF